MLDNPQTFYKRNIIDWEEGNGGGRCIDGRKQCEDRKNRGERELKLFKEEVWKETGWERKSLLSTYLNSHYYQHI